MKKSIIFKILCVALSALTLCFAFAACGDKDVAIIGGADGPTKIIVGESTDTVKVRFDMECGGKDIGSFTMMLYPEYAPITVENFVGLVQEGFYDGVTFHRIAEGKLGPFVAQGGDPDGDGRTNPGQKQIKGEFAANGVDNPLADSHTRGVVSMARTNDYNSASSQFFIC
ncbi:MAG: peptidylprolyl isomerase, partial [Clostridia bacterium]|nr:peptidylprolyl isomerase [Clostridia bacterium]